MYDLKISKNIIGIYKINLLTVIIKIAKKRNFVGEISKFEAAILKLLVVLQQATGMLN